MQITNENVSDVMARIARLEEQMQLLQAQNVIQKLMYKYIQAVDQVHIEEVVECFTPDGTGEFTPFADGFSGHDGIRAFLTAFRGPLAPTPRLAHVVHFPGGPLLEVALERATGQWDWLATCTIEREEGQFVAAWQLGRYDADFALTADGWKIQHLKTTYYEVFEHLRGWVGVSKVSLGRRDSER